MRVVGDYAQWFGGTGGMLYLRTANGTAITLEKRAANEEFQHILQRHLVAFWDGTKATKTTLWPANIAPGDMLNLLSEASSKFVGTEGAQTVQLSNGITARLFVANGKVITFYPIAGPGVVRASELVAAMK